MTSQGSSLPQSLHYRLLHGMKAEADIEHNELVENVLSENVKTSSRRRSARIAQQGRESVGQSNSVESIDTANAEAKCKKSKRSVRPKTKNVSPYFADYSISDRQAVSNDAFGLLQEVYAPDPYKILIVAMFLTQTPGRRARPFVQRFFEQYTDAETLSKANVDVLAEEIRPLGLHVIRAKRFILFAQMYLSHPPIKDQVSLRKGIPRRLQYPATEVSHLPGCGPYAMDCYRIFCTENGWRSVRPEDKELKPYIQWRWAQEGVDYLQLWQSDASVR